MKKIIAVFVLFLFILPLFASGIVEKTADGGLSGLFSLVKDELASISGEVYGAEVHVEEERAVSAEPVLLSSSFSYYGYNLGYSLYSGHGEVSVPQGMTNEDVSFVFTILKDRFPFLEEVSFSCGRGKVYLSYPVVEKETLERISPEIEEYVRYLIRSLYETDERNAADEVAIAKEEVTAADAYAAEAEKTAETRAAEQISDSAESSAEVETASAPVSEKTSRTEELPLPVKEEKTAEETIAAPAVPSEKKKITDCTFTLGFGVRGKFFYEKGSQFIYPVASVRAQYLIGWFFMDAKADVMTFKDSSYRFIVGNADLDAGVRIGGDAFSVFAYGGGRYTVSSRNSGFTNGLKTVFGGGVEIGFERGLGLIAGYEYCDSTHFFNAALRIKL